jgi:hypothetical protein
MIQIIGRLFSVVLLLMTSLAAGADELRWRAFDPAMSDQDYERTYSENQRFLRKSVTAYSEETLMAIGVPKSGVKLVGAAAGLAAGADARFQLGEGNLFAVEFKDATEKDRAVFFGIKKEW